jgi:uncharacterized membrane protein YeaQ/YmgE (transglycosylase-associated protein family)
MWALPICPMRAVRYLAGLLVKGDESLGVIGHIAPGIVGALIGGFIPGVLTSGADYITGINIATMWLQRSAR